jgi:transposase
MKKNKPTDLDTDMPFNGNKLFLALELSKSKWGLCFSDGKRLRHRTITARARTELLKEIALAKEKLGFGPDCEVHSCYEAGRDGFWLHRFLDQNGVKNSIFDPASIEIDRRRRRSKTDRIDAEKLVRLLMRIVLCGEKKVCAVVRVPTPEQEAIMRVSRERERLVRESTAHRARIRSILFLHGIEFRSAVERLVPSALRDWDSQPLPQEVIEELERELARLSQVRGQLATLQKGQRQRLQEPQMEETRKAAKLIEFNGVGLQSSWLLAHEFFWRNFNNRRQVGSCAGLTGSPYDSGTMERELGISKAGNRRVRTLCIEMAWNWTRFQPQSQLSQWFFENFGHNRRTKRIGIVALARKLLVALWKYLHFGLVPEGAILKA